MQFFKWFSKISKLEKIFKNTVQPYIQHQLQLL